MYEIIKHYRENCDYELAYQFFILADKIRNTHTSRNYLFTEMDVYNYKIDYEFSIIGYYANPDKINIKRTCMTVIKHDYIEHNVFSNVLSNYKFYTDALTNLSIPILTVNLHLLQTIFILLIESFDTNITNIVSKYHQKIITTRPYSLPSYNTKVMGYFWFNMNHNRSSVF